MGSASHWLPRRTRISQAEAVRGASKGQQAALRLDSADQTFQQLADVLLHGHLLRRRKQLNDEVEQAVGEVCEIPQLDVGPRRRHRGRRGLAGEGVTVGVGIGHRGGHVYSLAGVPDTGASCTARGLEVDVVADDGEQYKPRQPSRFQLRRHVHHRVVVLYTVVCGVSQITSE